MTTRHVALRGPLDLLQPGATGVERGLRLGDLAGVTGRLGRVEVGLQRRDRGVELRGSAPSHCVVL